MMAAVLLWFRTNPRNAVAFGLLIGALLLGGWLYAKGRHDAAEKAEAARAVAIAQAKAINAGALGKAAAERSSDAAEVVALQENLTDAYANTPDTAPSGVRLRLSCERLRGTAEARLPEFARLCGPSR